MTSDELRQELVSLIKTHIKKIVDLDKLHLVIDDNHHADYHTNDFDEACLAYKPLEVGKIGDGLDLAIEDAFTLLGLWPSCSV